MMLGDVVSPLLPSSMNYGLLKPHAIHTQRPKAGSPLFLIGILYPSTLVLQAKGRDQTHVWKSELAKLGGKWGDKSFARSCCLPMGPGKKKGEKKNTHAASASLGSEGVLQIRARLPAAGRCSCRPSRACDLSQGGGSFGVSRSFARVGSEVGSWKAGMLRPKAISATIEGGKHKSGAGRGEGLLGRPGSWSVGSTVWQLILLSCLRFSYRVHGN